VYFAKGDLRHPLSLLCDNNFNELFISLPYKCKVNLTSRKSVISIRKAPWRRVTMPKGRFEMFPASRSPSMKITPPRLPQLPLSSQTLIVESSEHARISGETVSTNIKLSTRTENP